MKYNIGNKVLIKSNIEPLYFPKDCCGRVFRIIDVTYEGDTPVYVMTYSEATISFVDSGDKPPKKITRNVNMYVSEEEVEKLVESCEKPLSYEPTEEDIMLINYAHKFGYKYIVPFANGIGAMYKRKPVQDRNFPLNANRNYWIRCDNTGCLFLLPKHLSFQTNDDTEPYCIEEHLEYIKSFV